MRLTDGGIWRKFGYRVPELVDGKSIHIIVGQVVDLPKQVAARMLRDFPQDFVRVDAEAGPQATIIHAAVDLARLRKPDAPIKVGALVTTYNGLDMTARLFASLEPVPDVDLQVYVVDNCSTDGTYEWLMANRVPFEQPLGRCSVAEALNRGHEYFLGQESPPDYLLMLNNDVAICADYVKALVEYAESNLRAGWVVGCWRAFLNMDTWPAITTHGLNSVDTKLHGPDGVRYRGKPVNMEAFHEVGDSSATLHRVQAIRETGPYDERFRPRYGEDEDYLIRMALADWEAWRLPVAYDGITAGYQTCTYESDTQRATGAAAYQRYVNKWGDAPRSAAKYYGTFPEILAPGGEKLPCESYVSGRPDAVTPPVQRGRGKTKTAAIVQNGHIGDILLSFPMATELKRLGYAVAWYAIEPYTQIAALCPDVDEVIDTSGFELSPINAQPFQRASLPARQDAEARGYYPVVLAQISPESQAEYLADTTRLGYVPFMFHRNGFHPRSYRPRLKPEPKPVQAARARALARAGLRGRKRRPRVLLNLAAESVPIRVDYGYWSRVAEELRGVVDVVYNEPNDGAAWRGDFAVCRLQPYRDIRCVPYMAKGFDLVVSVTTAPFWSAFIHDIPGIVLLPRGQLGLLKPGLMLRKNSMQLCGLLREWQAMDLVVADTGSIERLEPRQLADLVRAHLEDGADLRALHAETYADLFRGC